MRPFPSHRHICLALYHSTDKNNWRRLDDRLTKMLQVALNRSWNRWPSPHTHTKKNKHLYGHLIFILQLTWVRRMRFLCSWRSKDEFINDIVDINTQTLDIHSKYIFSRQSLTFLPANKCVKRTVIPCITVYTVDGLGNVYLQDYKIMWTKYNAVYIIYLFIKINYLKFIKIN